MHPCGYEQLGGNKAVYNHPDDEYETDLGMYTIRARAHADAVAPH